MRLARSSAALEWIASDKTARRHTIIRSTAQFNMTALGGHVPLPVARPAQRLTDAKYPNENVLSMSTRERLLGTRGWGEITSRTTGG